MSNSQILNSKISKNSFFAIGALLLFAMLHFLLSIGNIPLISIPILAFIIISIFNIKIGLLIVLFLPILGELSRFNLLGQSLILSDIFMPILFAIWLFSNKKDFKISSQTKYFLFFTALFFFIATISLIWNLIDIPLAISAKNSLYLVRLFSYFSIFLITLSAAKSHNSVKKVMIISIAIIAALGILQLQFFPNFEDLVEYGYDPHINRLASTWLDPNFVGGFFAITTCILAGYFFAIKKTKTRIQIAILCALLAICTFLTYSRSAYLALFFGLFIIGLIKSRQLIIIGLILAIIGLSISDRAQQRTAELFTSITSFLNINTIENPDPTARLRVQNWQQTFEIIYEKPFLGHGYNNLSHVKLTKGHIKSLDINSASGTDSSLLTIFATTGIFGLAIFLLLILQNLFLAFKNINSQKTELKALSIGLAGALPALILHSSFVNSLLFPQIMIFLWATLAIFHSNLISQSR